MPARQRNDEERADRLIQRGAISTALGFLIRLGARFLFLFVAGHFFGAALFGAYSIAVAVLEASVGFAGLSLKKTLFQLLDRNSDRDIPAFHIVIDAAILALGASAGVATLIMVTTALLPSSVLAADTAIALFWIAPMIAGQALVDTLFAATRWKHAIRYEVIGRSIVEPYSLLIGTLAAYGLGFHHGGLVIGYWVGNIVINSYAFVALRRCFPTLAISGYRADRLYPTLRALIPNTGTELLNAVFSRIDLYLVGLFLGERWAGIYGMAQQIRTPLRQVRQSFDSLLVPMVSKTLAAKGTPATVEALATAARLILSIQMAFLLAIIAIGAQILELFGPGFGAGYIALVLLTAVEAMQGTLGLGDLLFVYLRPHTGLRIMIVSLIICVASAIVLIPHWGIEGAAGAMLLAATLQALLRRLALRIRLQVRPPIMRLLPPLLAGAAGLGFVLATIAPPSKGLAWSAILLLLAALGVYAAVLAASLRAAGQKLAISGFVSSAENS